MPPGFFTIANHNRLISPIRQSPVQHQLKDSIIVGQQNLHRPSDQSAME
jgi:hypothetical protein